MRSVADHPIGRRADDPDKYNVCQRIGLPENPVTNLVYGFLLYLKGKTRAYELLQTLPNLARIPKHHQEDMALSLARTMYNGGIEEVAKIFRLYALKRGDALDGADFQHHFPGFLENCYGRELVTDCSRRPKGRATPRQKEVARYTSGIERDLAEVNKRSGLKCGI